jgi:hypothetical protein
MSSVVPAVTMSALPEEKTMRTVSGSTFDTYWMGTLASV